LVTLLLNIGEQPFWDVLWDRMIRAADTPIIYRPITLCSNDIGARIASLVITVLK
jgi:hypothetical protein